MKSILVASLETGKSISRNQMMREVRRCKVREGRGDGTMTAILVLVCIRKH